MAESQTILVTGATGRQGGGVIRALTGKGFVIRAMTRHPEGDAAKALAKSGATVVKGDLDDEPSLRAALSGAWGVFAVQNTWEAGVEKEEEQGKRLARLARTSGVQHFVYSSVGSAHRKTGIPHFENKARVEEVVRGLSFTSHVILRPVFFMENLLTPWFLNGDTLYAAIDPKTRLQMIAANDIGLYGARSLHRCRAAERARDRHRRRRRDDAGDGSRVEPRPRTRHQLRARADRGRPQEQRGLRHDARVVRSRRLQRRHSQARERVRHRVDQTRCLGGRAEDLATRVELPTSNSQFPSSWTRGGSWRLGVGSWELGVLNQDARRLLMAGRAVTP